MLEVADAILTHLPIHVERIFLGAHAVPMNMLTGQMNTLSLYAIL